MRLRINLAVKHFGRIRRYARKRMRPWKNFRQIGLTWKILRPSSALRSFSEATFEGGAGERVLPSRSLSQSGRPIRIASPDVRILRLSSVTFEPHQDIFFYDGLAYKQSLGPKADFGLLRELHSHQSTVVLSSTRNTVLVNRNQLEEAVPIKAGAILSGRWPENFYHLVIGILPKAFALTRLISLPPSVPLLVSEYLKGSVGLEILRILVGDSREVLFLPHAPHVVGDAYVIDAPVPEVALLKGLRTPPYRKLGSFNFELMRAYRNTILEAASSSNLPGRAVYPPKVYLKRNGRRRMNNELEVQELMMSNGFVPIVLEEEPFLEQVRIFSAAKFIVSTTGAQWTGSFLTNGARCLIIEPEFLFESTLFSKLLHLGNSQLFELPMVVGAESWDSFLLSGESGVVDLSKLQRAINQLQEATP